MRDPLVENQKNHQLERVLCRLCSAQCICCFLVGSFAGVVAIIKSSPVGDKWHCSDFIDNVFLKKEAWLSGWVQSTGWKRKSLCSGIVSYDYINYLVVCKKKLLLKNVIEFILLGGLPCVMTWHFNNLWLKNILNTL